MDQAENIEIGETPINKEEGKWAQRFNRCYLSGKRGLRETGMMREVGQVKESGELRNEGLEDFKRAENEEQGKLEGEEPGDFDKIEGLNTGFHQEGKPRGNRSKDNEKVRGPGRPKLNF